MESRPIHSQYWELRRHGTVAMSPQMRVPTQVARQVPQDGRGAPYTGAGELDTTHEQPPGGAGSDSRGSVLHLQVRASRPAHFQEKFGVPDGRPADSGGTLAGDRQDALAWLVRIHNARHAHAPRNYGYERCFQGHSAFLSTCH